MHKNSFLSASSLAFFALTVHIIHIMEKTKKQYLTDQTEERIYLYIHGQGCVFGDALPKEEEFAEILGVSRTITREALSRLKAAGIVESRRRRGMILKKPDLFAGLDKLIKYDIIDDRTRKEFAELRLVIELGLADLIYVNRTAEAIDELENICSEFRNEQTDLQKHLAAEKDFHRRLLAMSGNELIERFQLLLEPFFSPHKKLPQTTLRNSYIEHMELVNALRGHSIAEWRRVAHKHFGHYFNSR